MADDRCAYSGNRAVLFIGQQTRVRERQRDVTARSHGRRQGDEDVKRIHRIAAKAYGFAVGCFYVADDQIGMQLDADTGWKRR